MATDPHAVRLDLWHETRDGRATLINLSENHTFRVDAPTGTTVLRLHRPGYQTAASIRSELAWLQALRTETDLPVVTPLPGIDGELLQELTPGQYAVLFAFEAGRELEQGTAALFATLGRFAAIAHRHAEAWQRPTGFVRPVWTTQSMLQPDGLWGDWRRAPGATAVRDLLEVTEARLVRDLSAYGRAQDRFGLIHADMRLANLLLDGDRTVLLDFDDCGTGWFLYDLAAALSFIETRPEAGELQDAWLSAYTSIRPLSAADLAIIPAMILLRRMVLLAWIGTHAETALAQSQAPHFAGGTAALARAWLETA